MMAPRAAVAMRALAATNAVLVLLVVMLMRRLRSKAQCLNVFVDEVGQARYSTNAAAWTLKLVWSSGCIRKEVSLASSGAPASVGPAEKLELAVKSKHGMQLRGHTTTVDVDHFGGYVCANCELFRRSPLGGWINMPILNAERHHMSLFKFRGYISLNDRNRVQGDLEQLLGQASFTVGKPLAENCLPGFQTAMAVEFLDSDVLEDLRTYATANAHLISWYKSTSDGATLHVCL